MDIDFAKTKEIYGKDIIKEMKNSIPSVLNKPVNRIKDIEKLGLNKKTTLQIVCSGLSGKELKEMIETCRKHNIEVTSTIFRRTKQEIKDIIEIARANNIEIKDSIFRKKTKEIEERISLIENINEPLINEEDRFNAIFGLFKTKYQKRKYTKVKILIRPLAKTTIAVL